MSFTTPEPNRDPPQRKRSRADDVFGDSPSAVATPNDGNAEDAASKGGHSLRKRARVNYATEHIEDEVIVPNSSSASARFKKRRSIGHEDDAEDIYGSRPKRRGASLGVETTPSGRRRNPSRKSVESRAFMEPAEDDEHNTRRHEPEDEIHDTIQVGNWSMTSSSPSSKSDSKNSTANRSDSPDRDPNSQNQMSASHLLDTPTKPAEPAGTAQQDPDDVEADQAQDHVADPSEQLQNESFESLRAVPQAAYYPSSSIINKPSFALVRKSPATPSSQPNNAILTQSPGHIKVEAILDEEANNIKGQPFEEAHTPTPLPLDPQLEMSDEKLEDAKDDDDEALPQEQVQEAKSSPPKPSVEDVSMEDASSNTKLEEDAAEHAPVAEPASPESTEQTHQPEMEELPSSERAETQKPTPESVLGAPFKEGSVVEKPVPVSVPDPRWCRPQPAPLGKWSYLTPYVNGEYSVYPEKKLREDDEASEDQSPEDKDSKENNDVDGGVDDNDDGADAVGTELPTPALNTPTRGSPVPEAMDLTAMNSPMPGGDDADDADGSESQDPVDRKKHWRYRKLRDPEEFITVIEDYDNMNTADLYDMLQAINVSLVGWQDEWSALGKVVDDFENASRRRIADSKYETRTRNLHQHGVNHEEPEFAVRGYRAKEKETMSETRYLQAQDRVMAAAYGFEYDPHPSKIGKQNPGTQQAGVTTRGRSLRNQPRQTAKATEADGVTGKRQRKPVQLFDPAPQEEPSRASTPVPATRGRRRKNANADEDEAQPNFSSSFNEPTSDAEATGPGRRRRGARGRAGVPRIVEDYASSNGQSSAAPEDDIKPTPRRGRNRAAQKDEEVDTSFKSANADAQSEQRPQRRMLVLKIPKGRNLSEPSSAITDNGDSRPSTASSDSTNQTAESSYSFRPKRQKRFRDEPDEHGVVTQQPPKKRNRRTGPAEEIDDDMMTVAEPVTPAGASQSNGTGRKGIKIKASRPSAGPAPESRNGTPASQTNEGSEDQPKEYRAMTKSEKMSASMKSETNRNQLIVIVILTSISRSMGQWKHGWCCREAKSHPRGQEGCSSRGRATCRAHCSQAKGQAEQEGACAFAGRESGFYARSSASASSLSASSPSSPHAHQGPPPPPPPPHHHHQHQPHPHQHPHHPHHPHRDYPGIGAPFHS